MSSAASRSAKRRRISAGPEPRESAKASDESRELRLFKRRLAKAEREKHEEAEMRKDLMEEIRRLKSKVGPPREVIDVEEGDDADGEEEEHDDAAAAPPGVVANQGHPAALAPAPHPPAAVAVKPEPGTTSETAVSIVLAAEAVALVEATNGGQVEARECSPEYVISKPRAPIVRGDNDLSLFQRASPWRKPDPMWILLCPVLDSRGVCSFSIVENNLSRRFWANVVGGDINIVVLPEEEAKKLETFSAKVRCTSV